MERALARLRVVGECLLDEVGLPASAYQMDGVELWGTASFIKGGLFHADKLTTVSPSISLVGAAQHRCAATTAS